MATQAECALWLDMSERRFRELLDEGVISRAEKGQFDPRAVVTEYVRHLRAIAAGRAGEQEQQARATADARKAAAQAEMAEMELAERKGLLIPADEIGETLAAVVSIMKTRLMGMPTKLARLVGARVPAEAEKVIRAEVVEALTELSKVRVTGQVPADA